MKITPYFNRFYPPECLAIQKQIISEIEKAESEIIAAVYMVTDIKIINTLKQKAEEGVAVKLALKAHKENLAAWDKAPHQPKLELLWRTRNGDRYYLHHKFAVIDQATVITGSYNWTKNAHFHQENIVVISDAKEIARQYMGEFDRLIVRGSKVREQKKLNETWRKRVLQSKRSVDDYNREVTRRLDAFMDNLDVDDDDDDV